MITGKTRMFLGGILAGGLVLKLLFWQVLGKFYFGTESFYIQGDTGAYLSSIINLIEHGKYMGDLNSPESFAERMPGYPLFLGLFYLLSGKSQPGMIPLVVVAQILLNSVSTFLIFRVGQKLFQKDTPALLASALFAAYPFLLYWTPVLYAESLSIDLLVATLWSLLFLPEKYRYLLVGALIGLGALVRPQLVLLLGSAGLFLLAVSGWNWKFIFRNSFLLGLGFLLVFGWWPLRNYVNYGKPVFMMNLNTSRFMSMDRLNFAYFMWAIKTDWEPQISQLINEEKVDLPAWLWEMSPEDSKKLDEALSLSMQCGDGFRMLKRLPQLPKEEDCTDQVAELWKDLRLSVIRHHPFHFYIKVPLSNLRKAFFKTGLIESHNRSQKAGAIQALATLLFFFRTLLIFSGLVGLALWLKNKKNLLPHFLFVGFFFAAWYFYLCFVYRDMDIRYLLPADVLLLIPAGWLFAEAFNSVTLRWKAT